MKNFVLCGSSIVSVLVSILTLSNAVNGSRTDNQALHTMEQAQASQPVKQVHLNNTTYTLHRNKVTIGNHKAIFPTAIGAQTIPYMHVKANQRNTFINRIGHSAVKAYKQNPNSHILPSVTIANAIISSNFGRSYLYTNANNIFATKGSYQGQSVMLNAFKGHKNGMATKENTAFAKYPNLVNSINDYNNFTQRVYLRNNNSKSYVHDAKLIQKHSGAKHTHYAKYLVQLIKQYHLTKYDKLVK